MNNKQALLDAYNQLTKEERCAYQSLVALDEVISQKDLQRILRLSEVYLSQTEVRQMANKFKAANLLDPHQNMMTINPAIQNTVLASFVKESYFEEVWKHICDIFPVREKYHYGDHELRHKRNLFIAYHQNDEPAFTTAFKKIIQAVANPGYSLDVSKLNLYPFLFENFTSDRFENLQPYIRIQSLGYLYVHCPAYSLDEQMLQEAVKKELLKKDNIPKQPLISNYVESMLWLGNVADVEAILKLYPNPILEVQLQGLKHFLIGEKSKSIELFETSLKLTRKSLGKRAYFHGGIIGVMHLIGMLTEGKPENLKKAETYLNQSKSDLNLLLRPLLYFLQNNDQDAKRLLELRIPTYTKAILLALLTRFWINGKLSKNDIELLKQKLNVVDEVSNKWIWFEMNQLLSKADKVSDLTQKELDRIKQTNSWVPLVDRFQKEEDWSRALSALESSFTSGKKSAIVGKSAKRIIWMFDQMTHELRPVEQNLGKTNKWSKGRRMALKRLSKEGAPDFAIAEDLPIISSIRQISSYGGYWGAQEEWEINMNKATKHLAGHPHIFLEASPETRCDFVLEKPTLMVEKKGDSIQLKIEPKIHNTGVFIEEINPTRFRILEVTKELFGIYKAINGNTLTLPRQSKDRLTNVLNAISGRVDVQSEVSGDKKSAKEIKSKNLPCVHLLPVADGFSIQLFIKPIKNEAIYLKPEEGKDKIYATVNGEKCIINRNLQSEAKNIQALFDACAVLRNYDDGTYVWELNELQLSLQLLLELKALNNKVIVEWPKGERLKINTLIHPDNLLLSINKKNDWFNINGEVRVNNKVLMKLEELLKLNNEKSTGEFIEIGDGEFIALTTALKKKLDELNRYTSTEKNEIKLNPLTALLFQDIDHVLTNTVTDNAWKEQKKKVEDAYAHSSPVPHNLQADLRLYQTTGYEWLCQLYEIGAGACLADDMGLGKTIQTIALLIYKAEVGPSLIIAPASVVPNWESEINRFAPVLNVHQLNSQNKKLDIKKLGPFDVVIASYGIIIPRKDEIKKIEWNIISLDEAQFIKNRKTKRSETVMQLTSGFKMATTGTPIENHLGELWNLFNFINPGLLGSNMTFQQKYLIPIEKGDDKEARYHLQKLIKPFILRRRKSEVLQELPSKTEITLHVDLSEDEKAFYDAYRLKAIQDIEASAEEAGGQGNNMQVLAEITKLRQLSCNIKLIEPDTKIASSKLQLLQNVLEEILENNHQVLIFSQFVSHLSLIRESLDESGIKYQYLDGQTPIAKRKERVDAFQKGDGDVFLISLKAGGTGLNLTAADYVIHMDPWWNPAVEDQASDRVHRIGQQRPVTIYRLVSKETIEEKIIKLHQNKRDLAKGLLEGTDKAGKVNIKELLSLMKD